MPVNAYDDDDDDDDVCVCVCVCVCVWERERERERERLIHTMIADNISQQQISPDTFSGNSIWFWCFVYWVLPWYGKVDSSRDVLCSSPCEKMNGRKIIIKKLL
jgi:hypothetical protein